MISIWILVSNWKCSNLFPHFLIIEKNPDFCLQLNWSKTDMAKPLKKNAKTQYFATISGDFYSMNSTNLFIPEKIWIVKKTHFFLLNKSKSVDDGIWLWCWLVINGSSIASIREKSIEDGRSQCRRNILDWINNFPWCSHWKHFTWLRCYVYRLAKFDSLDWFSSIGELNTHIQNWWIYF